MIRPEDQRLLQPHLLAGERLLWIGRPGQGLIFRGPDYFDLALALTVACALLVWQVGEESKDQSPSSWWLAFAILSALYSVFRSFLRDAWLRSALLYAVSDRRVIVLRTRLRRRLCALDIGDLSVPQVDGEGDLGSVRFDTGEAKVDPLFRNDYSRLNPSGWSQLSFERIEHPEMVASLISRESVRRRRALADSAYADPIFKR